MSPSNNLGPIEQQQITRELLKLLEPNLKNMTLYNYSAIEQYEDHLDDPLKPWTQSSGYITPGYSDEEFQEYVNNLESSVIKDLVENPFMVVAGGAPRDWYLGNPCRDVDVYIYVHTKYISNIDVLLKNTQKGASFSFLNFVQNFGLNFDLVTEKTNNRWMQYGKNQLISVVEVTYKGLTFDLIFKALNKEQMLPDYSKESLVKTCPMKYIMKGQIFESIWNTYDTNVCEFGFDYKTNTILKSPRAELGLSEKVLRVNVIGNDMYWIKHYNKLVDKFPDFITRINYFQNIL